jgi:tRNA-modifying protein YgfZ
MTKLQFSPQVRPDRAAISLQGGGALAFLHNLLSCDVAQLAVGQAAYGALLSPQGKILHDVFVLNTDRFVLIDCALEQREALLQKLQLYKLRAKIEIKVRDDLDIVVGASGYVDPRSAALGPREFAPKGTFAMGEHYDAARIAAGLADSVADLGSNIFFPHEANFDTFGGVSFTKGCYVGQEVVSRMQHRGTARARTMRITSDQPMPPKGSEIRSENVLIGEVLSSNGQIALALIRQDRLAEATAPLTSGTVNIKVHQ